MRVPRKRSPRGFHRCYERVVLPTVKVGEKFRRVLAKYEEIYCHSNPLFGLTLARILY